MRIALDVFGGDSAPLATINGAKLAQIEARKTGHSDLEIILVGSRSSLESNITDLPEKIEICDVADASNQDKSGFISAGNNPDSAIRTALRLHRQRDFDAVVSAGPTGTQVLASLNELEKCARITRPAIGTLLPTATGQCFVLDVGASLAANPHHLVQFAVMGYVYVQEVCGVINPRIGVLNVGHESEIGDKATVDTNRLLSESGLNYIGFVEGNDLQFDIADVVVTNGFVGNVLLKYTEGLPVLIKPFLSEKSWESFSKKYDYQSLGGEPLLGVKGVSIICHGASTDKAICAAIFRAVKIIKLKLHEKLEEFLINQFASYFSQVKYLRSFRRSPKWLDRLMSEEPDEI